MFVQYVNPAGRPDRTDSYTAGLRRYELKDHLGNVRVVVSDDRTATAPAEATAAYQYYAFGSPMPGRYGLANLVGQGGYRYGFNGKEKDDDLTGTTGATYDYGFRIYDARIAKFLSVDPLTKDYPSWSPYPFAMSRPIDGVDLDGLEWFPCTGRSVMGAEAYSNYCKGEAEAFKSIVEDVKILITGKNFDGEQKNRVLASLFVLVDVTPAKAFKPIIKVTKEIVKIGSGFLKGFKVLNKFKYGEKVFKTADEFREAYKNSSDRVNAYKSIADDVAEQNGWNRNNALMKKNKGRTIYSDKKGSNYSLDTETGSFEVTNKHGKHQGEINFDGKVIDVPDLKGGHDIKVK